MPDEPRAIFMFFDDSPGGLVVYPGLSHARESIESLDVTGDQEAYTEAGQGVSVTATNDLFAEVSLTENHDLPRLQHLLRGSRGPAKLGHDPLAYAEEWWRLDEMESRRPFFVPQRLFQWLRTRTAGRASSPSA